MKFIYMLLILLISIPAFSNSDKGFSLMLVKAEVNSDVLSPSDEFILTATWQNVGDRASEVPLKCFMELEFGYQRSMENTKKDHRFIWEPMPSMYYWNPGELHTVSYKVKLPEVWGGSYDIFLGVYDEKNQSIGIIGDKQNLVKRIHVGEVSISWGWGVATMELVRKPILKQVNAPRSIKNEKTVVASHVLGDEIKASFDKAQPALQKVQKGSTTHDIKSFKPLVVFRDYLNDKILTSNSKDVSVKYKSLAYGKDSIIYNGSIQFDKRNIADFEIKINVNERSIIYELGKVKENLNYELLEVRFPSIYSTSNLDANIVSFLGGGKLISLRNSHPMGFDSHYDTRNAVGIYDPHNAVVFESTCLDDRLYTMIEKVNSVKSAIVGGSICNRVAGKNRVRSIQVPNVHELTLTFLDDSVGEFSWIDVAKYLRKDLKGVSREKFRNSVFGLYYNTGGPEPQPWQVKEDSPYSITRLNRGMRFNKVKEVLSNYSNLLDGYRQIMQLFGWFKYQDDKRELIGFPASFTSGTDHRAGTMSELLDLLKSTRSFNAWVQFYDNYDEIYKTRYNDTTVIAKDAYGKDWKGWFWTAGQSYIIGQHKYWETGKAKERIAKMMSMFNIKDVTHFDVLSSEPLRYDFDSVYPASAHTNYLAKLNLIKEYNKYGVDVSSETLSHPFVGHISYAYHTRMNPQDRYFTAEKFIPLIPAIYHGTIGYNSTSSDTIKSNQILDQFITGSRFGYELEKEDYKFIKMTYLQNMPMNKLYDEKWEDYSEVDDSYFIKYTNNSHVKVDKKTKCYEIVYKGKVIGKDWTTFIEGVKASTYLAFSLEGGLMEYDSPNGWLDNSKLKAVTLTKKGTGEFIPCKIENGKFKIDMPASVPIRISYGL